MFRWTPPRVVTSHNHFLLPLTKFQRNTFELAFFSSPLLYHGLPTVRTVTGPDGRRYSYAETPRHSLYYPSRRNTIAVVSSDHATGSNRAAIQNRLDNDPAFTYRGSSLETAPAYRKGGSMSKVVRGVKNITKGYSSVQVKVRNGMGSC